LVQFVNEFWKLGLPPALVQMVAVVDALGMEALSPVLTLLVVSFPGTTEWPFSHKSDHLYWNSSFSKTFQLSWTI
jgi:hypothetical protein